MGLFKERIGIFRGFGESRYEIVSEVLLPYQGGRMPLQGGFVIVGVEDLDRREAGILGRVVRAYPLGDLLTGAGEDYLVDLMKLNQPVPEAVRQGRLRYRMSVRLLGQIVEKGQGDLEFSPSVRIMPHVGAPVGFPCDDVYGMIARGVCRSKDRSRGSASIGHMAVGDLVFDGSDQARGRCFPVEFAVENLVGRRSAVFARAGMGKSNFVKVLLTRLNQEDGTGVGTLILDPDGEYAFANASEPGLLDVPGVAERVIVFTDRQDVDPKYERFIKGLCRINFSQLSPAEVVAHAVASEKQETVFANTVRGLEGGAWARLIRLLARERFRASAGSVAELVGRRLRGGGMDEDVIIGAVVNNLVPPILRLHDENSQLLALTMEHLRRGGLVILDLSMLTGSDAGRLAAWVLNSIFQNNQRFFTAPREEAAAGAGRGLIPTLAVMEEAQYYLGGREGMREDSPFVRWFKEGRKYQLGSLLVTQQPGAVGPELISQCDSFFVFHLLSGIDLDALSRANLHYSGDVITALASEPIPGNCYLWSGRGMSIVSCSRILEFRSLVRDAANQNTRAEDTATESLPAVSNPAPSAEESLRQLDTYLVQVVTDVLHTTKAVAIHGVSKCTWNGTTTGEYPSADELVAVNAYNLRFNVTDEIENPTSGREVVVGTTVKSLVLVPFGERRLIREDQLHKALRAGGFCPERFVARKTGQDNGSASNSEVYLLYRKRIPADRIRTQSPVEVTVLP